MDKQQLLEKAILGELSKEEQALVANLLANDASFKEQYAFEMAVKSRFEQEERVRLKTLFQAVPKDTKSLSLWWFPVAAAALLVATFIFWPEKPDLYATYYQKFPNIGEAITRSNKETNAKNPFICYEKGDYACALEGFKKMKGDTARFMVSMCYLEQKNMDYAKGSLALTYTGELENLRLWYLALIYIKEENHKDALPILENLSEQDFALQEKANELLEELK